MTKSVILNLIQDLFAFNQLRFCTQIAGQARNDSECVKRGFMA